MMTAVELANKCKSVAKNYKTVYMWGCFGQPVTESIISQKAKQYPSWYTAAKQAELRKYIGKGYFGTDCVGLVKTLLWNWDGDKEETNGGAKYASNGVPDLSADGMITKCIDVSTNFSNIQVGEFLWMSGHCGIYVGEGLAVECTPRWDGDVQITAVGNIGAKSGYNTRTWTKHGKLPYVTYTASTASTSPQKTPSASGKVDPALYFDKSYSKTYTVTAAALNMRKGAGITKGIIKVLKKGDKVNCYGYYNKNGSTVWLYAIDSKTGKIGYVSTKYLK